jgi:hypothetical protein
MTISGDFPSSEADQPPAAQPTRISVTVRRLVDGVVILALGLVAISIGRQLSEWWREDPADVIPPMSASTAWAQGPVEFAFGESTTHLERRTVGGSSREILAALSTLGEELLSASTWPTDTANEAELDWLKSLASEVADPVPSAAGNVYALNESLPSLVVTRFRDPNTSAATESAERIVAWGFAMPRAREEWTVYVFRRTGPPEPSKATSLAGDPVAPPGGRRLLQQRDEDGRLLIAFEGTGTLASWGDDFDRQFGKPLEIVGAESPLTRIRRYHDAARQRNIEAHLAIQPSGRLSAILWVETKSPTSPGPVAH